MHPAVEAIRSLVTGALDLPGDTDVTVGSPPDASMGDFAVPMFPFARVLRAAPPALAAKVVAAFEPGGPITEVNAAGPYVNVRVDRASFTAHVLGEIGRRGGKSTTACRVAVAECTGRAWPIPFGDRGIYAIVSVDKKSAKRRLATCSQMLTALGYQHTPTSELITFHDRPIDIQIYACNENAVIGDTWIGVCFDEMAKWKDKTTGANPASEVVASARPSLGSMRKHGAREWWISSPWAQMGLHYNTVELGTNEKQVAVSRIPTWQANPTFTEQMTHDEEPDEIKWRREWLCEPMPRAMTGMLDSRQVKWLDERPKHEVGDFITAGGDLGLKQDASALAIANKRREICIGVREAARSTDIDANFGVRLVPAKTTRYRLTADDALVVVAEDEL